MNRIKRNKKIAVGLWSLGLALSAQTVSAGVGISISAGSSDYEQSFEFSYDGVVEDENGYTMDGSFFYRDLTIDYSWGSHQVGVKFGGLANEDNVIESNTDLSDLGFGQAQLAENASAERDENSLFYSYRWENGIALTAGYLWADIDVSGKTVASFPDFNYTQTTSYVDSIENNGFFLGLAYGRSFTDKLGGFVRLGYQEANLTEFYESRSSDSDGADFGSGFQYAVESDGSATVGGVGLYYVVNSNWVVNLSYDVKNFSYDSAQPSIIDDGAKVDAAGAGVKVDESQNTVMVTLRYVF